MLPTSLDYFLNSTFLHKTLMQSRRHAIRTHEVATKIWRAWYSLGILEHFRYKIRIQIAFSVPSSGRGCLQQKVIGIKTSSWGHWFVGVCCRKWMGKWFDEKSLLINDVTTASFDITTLLFINFNYLFYYTPF